MKVKKLLTLFLGIFFAQNCISQDHLKERGSNYYNHWIGQWYKEVNGKRNDLPTFIIRQGLYKASFEETWIGAGGDFSKAWRAWDSRTQKWDFAWMSSDGLFQIWQGRMVNGVWYIYKTFILENGEKVLSRQAFIPEGSYTLHRTSEHSKDNGKTWKMRFKEKYLKKK